MRLRISFLFAVVLLSTQLISCISDHRSVSPSPGRNFRLSGFIATSSDTGPNVKVDSTVFQRDNNGKLLGSTTTFIVGNQPKAQFSQTFGYNADNLLVESRVTLNSPYTTVEVGSGERRIYQYENQKVSFIKKESFRPGNLPSETLFYEDRLAYDAQGRLVTVNRSYFIPSYSTSTPVYTSKLTYEYDARNNPVVINEVFKSIQGFGNATRIRKYTFEYDDKPNALTQIDVLAPFYLKLHNPFDVNDFYLGLATNNPTKQTLVSDLSSENSVYNFTYEYKDGLVYKASYTNSLSDNIITYQFTYTPY